MRLYVFKQRSILLSSNICFIDTAWNNLEQIETALISLATQEYLQAKKNISLQITGIKLQTIIDLFNAHLLNETHFSYSLTVVSMLFNHFILVTTIRSVTFNRYVHANQICSYSYNIFRYDSFARYDNLKLDRIRCKIISNVNEKIL